MESPNTSSQAIELNHSCLKEAHSNRPCTGPGYENTEPECIFAVLRVLSSIICPLRSPDSKTGKVLAQTAQLVPRSWHKWPLGLSWRAFGEPTYKTIKVMIRARDPQ